VEKTLRFAFITQVKSEAEQFVSIVEGLKARTYVEIGTSFGGTLFLMTRVLEEDGTLVGVDLPGRLGGYGNWRNPIYRSFARGRQTIRLVKSDSHVPETLQQVKEALRGQEVDVLFIDGDHSYEGVKKDFEMYSPLVRKGGIVAFHDVAWHAPETHSEAHKFWEEIKKQYKHEELIENRKQGWAGIGVLHL
jgi:predicted O-methyltransferase YrrM